MILPVVRCTHVPVLLAWVLVFAACSGERAVNVVTGPRWHVEARHATPGSLPAHAHPDVATIALPEVSWTGTPPETTSGERIAVGIYANGDVSFGESRLQLEAANCVEGLTELRAWWAVERGPDARLTAGDEPPRVEVYVDRSASWDRVRSVLLFLALPPQGLIDTRLVAVRSDGPDAPIHLPARVGVERRFARDSITFWSDADREWASSTRQLPPLGSAEDTERERFWTWRRLWLVRDREYFDRGSDALQLGAVVVDAPGRLDDPGVVARANEAWSAWVRDTLWARRGYSGVRLGVWWGGDEREPEFPAGPGPFHVPAAYPVQAIDLAHVDGRSLRSRLLERVHVSFDPPALLAGPRRGNALPLGVALACGLGAVLAFVSVFAGWRPTRRSRGGQPTVS